MTAALKKNSTEPSQKDTGRTQPVKDGAKSPRLPHEHDESADSTAQQPHESMKQASADLKRGLVDTDKGPEMDKTYKPLREGKTKP